MALRQIKHNRFSVSQSTLYTTYLACQGAALAVTEREICLYQICEYQVSIGLT